MFQLNPKTKLNALKIYHFQGGETVYAQFDLWRSNWYASMDMDVQGALEGGLHGGLEESYGPPPPYPEYSQFSDVNYLFQVNPFLLIFIFIFLVIFSYLNIV